MMALVLTACNPKTINYEQHVNTSLTRPLPAGTNQRKPYFRYYLPPNMGVKASNEVASLIGIGNYELVMNLKVSRVIASQEEKALTPEDINEDLKANLLYEKEGQYVDINEQNQTFYITVFKQGDKHLSVLLENNQVEMIAVVAKEDFAYILEHMMLVLRSIEVDEEKVVKDFSNKEIVEDKTIHEDFFEHAVPESGSLIDMYNRLHPDDPIVENKQDNVEETKKKE